MPEEGSKPAVAVETGKEAGKQDIYDDTAASLFFITILCSQTGEQGTRV